MSANYVQSVEVKLPEGARFAQIFGIVLQLLGLGLIAVAVLYSPYAAIAVVALFLAGGAMTWRFYSAARKFDYSASDIRLAVIKTNLVGQSKIIADIRYDMMIAFELFRDAASAGDIVATGALSDPGVYAATCRGDAGEFRVLFAPDEYLVSLIKDAVSAAKRKREGEGGGK